MASEAVTVPVLKEYMSNTDAGLETAWHLITAVYVDIISVSIITFLCVSLLRGLIK